VRDLVAPRQAPVHPEPVGDGLRIIRAVAGIPGAAAEEELGRGGGAGEEGLGGEADGEGELEVVALPGAADPRVPPAGFFLAAVSRAEPGAVAVEEAVVVAASLEAVKALPALHSADAGAAGASPKDEAVAAAAAADWSSA
jgi:hypothetical protein